MDSHMGCYPLLSYDIRDYYEKVSKGQIEERPYAYWGPDTAEEEAHWQQCWLPIKKAFRPIDWDSGFTGRGGKSSISLFVKHKKKAMERPGIVGPMDEILVMDEDPLLETVIYRVDSGSTSEDEVGKRVKKHRRSSFEAACKVYKRAKEHLIAFLEVHRTRSSTGSPRSDTASIYLTEGIDKHHP